MTLRVLLGLWDRPVGLADPALRSVRLRLRLPAFARAAADLKTTVRFAKVDTERAKTVAGRFGIRSIPTLILFRGAREASRVSGAMDARSIASWLQQQL